MDKELVSLGEAIVQRILRKLKALERQAALNVHTRRVAVVIAIASMETMISGTCTWMRSTKSPTGRRPS